MAYTGTRGWKIGELKKKGITKHDGKKIELLSKQGLNTLYNKAGR